MENSTDDAADAQASSPPAQAPVATPSKPSGASKPAAKAGTVKAPEPAEPDPAVEPVAERGQAPMAREALIEQAVYRFGVSCAAVAGALHEAPDMLTIKDAQALLDDYLEREIT